MSLRPSALALKYRRIGSGRSSKTHSRGRRTYRSKPHQSPAVHCDPGKQQNTHASQFKSMAGPDFQPPSASIRPRRMSWTSVYIVVSAVVIVVLALGLLATTGAFKPNSSSPGLSVSATASHTIVDAYSAVLFNATASCGSGNYTLYAWSFGDGGSALGTSVSHYYVARGNYSATVTVTDSAGATAASNPIRITVPSVPITGSYSVIEMNATRFDLSIQIFPNMAWTDINYKIMNTSGATVPGVSYTVVTLTGSPIVSSTDGVTWTAHSPYTIDQELNSTQTVDVSLTTSNGFTSLLGDTLITIGLNGYSGSFTTVLQSSGP